MVPCPVRRVDADRARGPSGDFAPGPVHDMVRSTAIGQPFLARDLRREVFDAAHDLDQVVVSEVVWEFPAAGCPRSHWPSRGHVRHLSRTRFNSVAVSRIVMVRWRSPRP